jgi:hypothetical protein
VRRARKLACAVLALAVVTSVVYATGAFTTTTASRSADVQVTGDASAFLALQKSNGPNAAFASYGPNGALQVTMGGAGSRASGVNPDSRTEFENVFLITNKGAQPVSVWFTGKSPAVTFRKPDGTSIEGKAGAVTIRPGGQPLHVGLTIDARGVPPGKNLLESMTIHTDADMKGESAASANKDDKDESATSGTSRASTGSGDGFGSSLGESGGGTDESTGDGSGDGDSSEGGGGDGDSSDGGDESGNSGDDNGISADPAKAAKAVGLGATVGEAGYPTPEMTVWGHKISKITAKESDSPFYLLGQLLVTIVPGVDILADLRDAILNGLQGDWFEMFLSAAGIAPVVGSFGDAAQVVKIAKQWVGLFSGKVDEAFNLLQATLLKRLPASTGLKLADVFTDAPLTQIAKRSDGKAMLKHVGEFSSPRVDYLRKHGASWDNAWTLMKNDRVATAKRFQRKGIASPQDMAFYVENGAHPRVIESLRTGVMGIDRLALSPRQTRSLVRRASIAGFGLSRYGEVKAYCDWQKQRGFSNGTVKKSCNLIQPT